MIAMQLIHQCFLNMMDLIHQGLLALDPTALPAQIASSEPVHNLQRMHPDFLHTFPHMACMHKLDAFQYLLTHAQGCMLTQQGIWHQHGMHRGTYTTPAPSKTTLLLLYGAQWSKHNA